MSKTKKDLQMEEIQMKEHVRNLIKGYGSSGHRIPRTRREFLTSGLLAMSSTVMAPTLLQLLSSSAWASECDGVLANGAFPAFINLQLDGGPALFANYLARGNNGDPVDYSKMGMGANPRMETLFSNNAPFWIEPDASLPASGMVRGLFNAISRTGTDADIYAKTAFIAVAAESIDDRVTNQNDLSGLLAAAGVVGSSLPHLLTGYGAFLSETLVQPVNQFAGAVLPSATMLKVESAASIENGLSFKGALSTMPADMRARLLTAIETLSKTQVAALANTPNSSESQKILKNLINCATQKNKIVLSSSNIADIYNASFPNATAVAAIWAKNKLAAETNSEMMGKGLTTTLMNQVVERCGLAVANCMRGFSGAATINLGGYDYHAPFYSRASGALKDQFFGDIIGRILKTAKAFNRKVFIHVSADGSVFTNPSSSATINWVNDFPKAGMNYIIAYDPAGAPATGGYTKGSYSDTAYQLNHFGNALVNDPRFGGTALGVSNDHPIGSLDAQDLCGAAVFLNYLNFAKRPELIDTMALAKVKMRLTTAAGSANIFDFYTRIK